MGVLNPNTDRMPAGVNTICDMVLLGAFGAGFTWGATVVRWGIA